LGNRGIQDGNDSARRWLGGWRWLSAAVLIQALMLASLGAWLLHRPSPTASAALYSTLSSQSVHFTGDAPVRAVFSATMTLADLSSLLAP
jgi:hypothetical protein